MSELKKSITKFLAEVEIQHSFLNEVNYKPLDFDNLGTPESAFFKLPSNEMVTVLKAKFEDRKKACSYIDFYVKRSLEYMRDEDILKFNEIKRELLNS